MADKMRQKVVEEILTTEATYLRQLEVLDKYFVQPSLEKKILPPSVHHTVFGGLAALQEVSRELYHALLPGGKEEEEEKDVGGIFLQLAPFLKAYSSYVKNYQAALDMIVQCEGRQRSVRQWVSATEGRPEVQMKLSALLITPVQRIPRYLLLLAQLLHHTPPHHPHRHTIARAVEEVESVARFVDGSISEAENYQRVLMIQRALKGGKPTILAPGRWLIKEGMLYKMTRNGSSSHPRLFFLFSDVLMYTKLPSGPPPLSHTHRDTSTTTTPPPPPPPPPPPASPSPGSATPDYRPHSLEFCCILPLRHCVIIPLLGSGERELFRIKCEAEDLVVYSAEEVGGGGGEWVAALRGAVEQAVRKRRTLRKDSSSRKPVRRSDLRRNVENHTTTTTTTTTTFSTTTTTPTKSTGPSIAKILHHLPSTWLSPKNWISGATTTTTTTAATTTAATTTATTTTTATPLSSKMKLPKMTYSSTFGSSTKSKLSSAFCSSSTSTSSSSSSSSTSQRLASTNISLPSTSHHPQISSSTTSSTSSSTYYYSSPFSTYATPPKPSTITIALNKPDLISPTASSSTSSTSFSTFSPPRTISTAILGATSTQSLKITSSSTSSSTSSTCSSTRPISTPADYFTSTFSTSPYFNPYSSTSPPSSSSTSSSTYKRPRDPPKSGELGRKKVRRPFSLLQSP